MNSNVASSTNILNIHTASDACPTWKIWWVIVGCWMIGSAPVAQKQQKQWLVSHSIQNQGHPNLSLMQLEPMSLKSWIEEQMQLAQQRSISHHGQMGRNNKKTRQCLCFGPFELSWLYLARGLRIVAYFCPEYLVKDFWHLSTHALINEFYRTTFEVIEESCT